MEKSPINLSPSPADKNDGGVENIKEIKNIEITSEVNTILAIDRSNDENDSRFYSGYASIKKILETEKEAITNGTADLENLKYLNVFLSKKFDSKGYSENIYTKSYSIKDGKIYVLLDHVNNGSNGEQNRDNYIVITNEKLEKIGETEKIKYYLSKSTTVDIKKDSFENNPIEYVVDNPSLKRIVEVFDDIVKVEDKNGKIIDLKIKS